MVSPIINVLCGLANKLHDSLGLDQGTKHAIPDLSADIHALMDSLKEHKVYELVNGRALDSDDPPAKDVVSFRLQQLTDSAKNPLMDYNKAFTRLQRRRRMRPITTQPQSTPSTLPVMEIDPNIPSPAPVEPSGVASIDEEENMGEEEDLGEEEEQEGELVELMDELEHGFDEPTLPRLTEEDVAFDMDEVFHVDVDEDLEAPSEAEEEGEGDESEFDL